MPFDFKKTDNGLGISVTGWGAITDEEYECFAEGLIEESLTGIPPLYILCDYTAVTDVSLSRETLRAVAEKQIEASADMPDTIIAIIADGDLIFGLSRMWEILADRAKWDTHVFRSQTEAKDWIQIGVRFNPRGQNLTFQ
ncbi:MAG: hypothetical protein HN403_10600 [Rhodospirillales bacterium]|jgi:hypothetical protein|nr:hypothetical protein [Rhodospirillales bacterium]